MNPTCHWTGQLGQKGNWLLHANITNANVSYLGENVNDGIGWKLAGGGDVNRDGYDDFLIPSFQNSKGGNFAGQTYLILGKRDGWNKSIQLSKADASFIGYTHEESGFSVAMGDFNGDGYSDILIGAPYNSERGIEVGKIYLFFGSPQKWSMNTPLQDADIKFYGEKPEDYAGISVASAGDVNGDGIDDILISAEGNSDGGKNSGKTYLILGHRYNWTDMNLSDADASFVGIYPDELSGSAISSLGDINGDGLDDFAISLDFRELESS